MQLTDFEALSFDCYGTLIDWEAGLSAVLVPWARERGLTLTAEQLLTEYAGLEARSRRKNPPGSTQTSWPGACSSSGSSSAPR